MFAWFRNNMKNFISSILYLEKRWFSPIFPWRWCSVSTLEVEHLLLIKEERLDNAVSGLLRNLIKSCWTLLFTTSKRSESVVNGRYELRESAPEISHHQRLSQCLWILSSARPLGTHGGMKVSPGQNWGPIGDTEMLDNGLRCREHSVGRTRHTETWSSETLQTPFSIWQKSWFCSFTGAIGWYCPQAQFFMFADDDTRMFY